MFRKILIVAMFATAAGYCFAADVDLPQVVTSQVFYTDGGATMVEDTYVTTNQNDMSVSEMEMVAMAPAEIPVWPLAGSDADVTVTCDGATCAKNTSNNNVRIVSKIGADLVVENNFNMGARGDFGGWSGGANMLHGTQIPVGFDNECNNGSEMPLLHREMLEDDGGSILAVSRSGRNNCNKISDEYAAFAARNNMNVTADDLKKSGGVESEIAVDLSADAEAPRAIADQVRSWVVANGQTLREVLQDWCTKEGWDLVWTTPREYPIQASAVFKGRFVDVASALVRNFGRANPTPYAKFYKGNRVLVISTNED